MSGAGDDRWRGGRPDHLNRQSSQRHSRGGQGGGRGNQNANNWGGARDVSAGPQQEQHVPVLGFNAVESKTALRRGPGEPRPFYYKPSQKDMNNTRASGPWGSKPNTMANGKDFWLELRKQVTALQQGGNTAGG